MTTTWVSVAENSSSWTDVPKAIGTTSVVGLGGGDPIGLLLALTYSNMTIVTTDIWTKLTKSSTSWTGVPKAN